MNLLLQSFSIFLLGIIGGAVPGAILTSAFTEVVHKGFINSLRVILYAFISEVIVASLILFVFFSLYIPKSVFYFISFIGALVLIWIARQIWGVKALSDKGKLFDFRKIFLLTVFNGPLWIFWSTICVPQAYVLSQKITGGQFLFLALFEAGWLASTVVLTFLFSRFRPLLIKEGVMTIVFKIFAVLLILIAINLVVTSVMYFTKGLQ
jgi:threonine/homoserine/homoserine lactone efflux protein